MLPISGDIPPAPPARSVSTFPAKVTFKGAQTWRESVGMFLVLCLAVTALVSVIVLCVYCWKDKQVYEELVSYLDTTISVSKLIYNPQFGIYNLNEKELDVLERERTYKNLLRGYLFAEFGFWGLLAACAFVYMTMDLTIQAKRIVFWILIAITVGYALVETSIFTVAISPHSRRLPNETEMLLNHAIPYNTGGLKQMEDRLGCTFDFNLYDQRSSKRRANPKNSCDPQIENSFIPVFVLLFLFGLRLLPVLFFLLLALKRTPLSESIAANIEKLPKKRQRLYAKKPNKHARNSGLAESPAPKSTTFGVNTVRGTPLPPVPSPSQLDHSISYNNAAFVANTGLNSSLSSDLSRHENDIFRSNLNRPISSSIQSQV